MGTFLETSIEKRLSAWLKIQERQQLQRSETKLPTITISRRFGCEAFPLAQRLQKVLHERTGKSFVIFDRALLERVGKNERLDQHSLEKVGDFSHGLDFFATFLPSVKTHEELFNSIAVTIKDIAQQGGAIIIGRGAAVLTKDTPNCFHFRLDAPFEYRVESVMRRYNRSKKEAEVFVKNNESYREEFLNHFFDEEVSDVEFYDMIFNNSRISVEDIAEHIAAVLDPALKAELMKTA